MWPLFLANVLSSVLCFGVKFNLFVSDKDKRPSLGGPHPAQCGSTASMLPRSVFLLCVCVCVCARLVFPFHFKLNFECMLLVRANVKADTPPLPPSIFAL